MHKAKLQLLIFAVLVPMSGLPIWGEPAGSISGTITIKSKVKTKGTKSQKDVVVYLEKIGDNDYPPPKKHAKINQKDLVFIPHVLPIQKGTTVDFLNEDVVNHNVFSPDACCKMDLGNWGKGGVKNYLFNETGTGVMLCKLHPEMAAYVVVIESPYYITSEISRATKSAAYQIKNVPPGKYLLKTWNKKLKSFKKEIVIKSGKTVQLDFALRK